MFDFNTRRAICLDGMKGAFDVHLYGNNPRVMDGSWHELFADGAEGPTQGKREEHETPNGAKGGENGKKRVKGGEEASGEIGIDEDEGEAAEEGDGAPRGVGNNQGRSPGKRKRGQGTLDGVFAKGAGKGKRTRR